MRDRFRDPLICQEGCPNWDSPGGMKTRTGGDGGRKSVLDRIANAKNFGWAIYAAGFAIWLFGYLSTGHAPLFDWKSATPWWISSFVPNLEAEIGLALMFASMIPIYGRAVWGNWPRLFAFVTLLVFATVTLAWWGVLAWLFWRVIWGQARGRRQQWVAL
jgi:hypothetical protein